MPELRKKGYEPASAASLIAASGTIGVVIPPSVPMIIYAVIMLVIATSAVLSWTLSTNPFVIMLLVVAVILLTGVFIETASALIILTPVLLPLVTQLGIDPIHFGLIIVVGLAIGMITPPVAINLYVASSVTQLPLERITRAIIPYLLGLISVLLLVVYVPILLGLSG